MDNKITLLVLILATTLISSSKSTNLSSVRDTNGRNLRAGEEYHVVPLIWAQGGGLSLAQHENTTCPFYVSQEFSELDDGLPLTFYPVTKDDKFVRVSTDMNVQFSAATTCVQSTVWRMSDVDSKTGRRYIMTGGVKGNPGIGTVSNWFKIDKYGDKGYKLVHCPSVCQFCKVVCGDIGVYYEDGKRWLGLSDQPLVVVFKKKNA